MCLCGTSRPSSRGPRWAEGATPGPTPVEPFLRGHQATSVAQKMPTCLSHQSTQKINHPLPTHAVAMLWGAAPHRAPPKGRAEAAGILLGCQDLAGRWLAAVEAGGPATRAAPALGLAPSSCLVPELGKGLGHCSGGEGALGFRFPSRAGEITGPFHCFRMPRPECVQEALAMP